MTIDTKDMLNSILESISRISYIKPEEIPEIDLYMDQVTTFMESHLSSSRRHEGDKILTKTMINNYAKNNLLPPPVKKKYSKEHLLMLTFIYYLKNIFQMFYRNPPRIYHIYLYIYKVLLYSSFCSSFIFLFIMLYFIIPIKMKWMAGIYAVFYHCYHNGLYYQCHYYSK